MCNLENTNVPEMFVLCELEKKRVKAVHIILPRCSKTNACVPNLASISNITLGIVTTRLSDFEPIPIPVLCSS